MADGAQRLLGLGQARAQVLDLRRYAVVHGHRLIASYRIGLMIEAQQHALGARHVADDPAQRQRQLLDQGRRGDDLLAVRQRRLLIDVDDLEVVAALRGVPRRSRARSRRRASSAASCR